MSSLNKKNIFIVASWILRSGKFVKNMKFRVLVYLFITLFSSISVSIKQFSSVKAGYNNTTYFSEMQSESTQL